MSSTIHNDLFNNRLIDNGTGETVWARSLVKMEGAGYNGFQDTQYTGTNKLLVPSGTQVKLTFNNPSFVKEYLPQIGSKLYPMYNFDTQRVITHPQFKDSLFRIRLQFVAESVTGAAGQGVRVSLFSPDEGFYFDRNTVALIKGAGDPQRVRELFSFYADPATDTGLELYITPLNGDIRVYNANLLISCNM